MEQLQSDAPICGRHVVEQLLIVFTDNWFLVVAGHVVPSDAIVVDVVQDGQAGFTGSVDVEFRVVGLPLLLVSRLRPRVVAPSVWCLVRRGHLFAVRRPEPSVEALGFQVGTVLAALEVAQASRRPDVRHVIWNS